MSSLNTIMSTTSLYLISGADYSVVISDAHNNPEWNNFLNTCRLL